MAAGRAHCSNLAESRENICAQPPISIKYYSNVF